MKKLLLLITLLFSLTMFSQKSITYNYLYLSSTAKNYSITSVVKYAYPEDETKLTLELLNKKYVFYSNSEAVEGYADGGYHYKIVQAVSDENRKVTIQIFTTIPVIRFLFENGDNMEISK
jgi:hypothetical protein